MSAAAINLGNGTFSATTSGRISSSSGTIGGWSISGTSFSSSASRVASSINRNGNVIFGGNYGLIKFVTDPVRITTANKMVISDNYSASSLPTNNDTIAIRAYNGTIHINSNYGIYANNNRLDGSSSRNVKENIKKIKQEYINDIYREVNKMPFYTFDYKEKYGEKNQFGFIIEEIENSCLKEVLKIRQNEENELIKSYSPLELSKMNLLLIKELMKRNEKLENKCKELEEKIQSLKKGDDK